LEELGADLVGLELGRMEEELEAMFIVGSLAFVVLLAWDVVVED